MIPPLIPVLQRKGYVVYDELMQLNIVGIRISPPGTPTFNDRIVVFCRVTEKKWWSFTFAATTDPGSYWLRNPINPGGTAILVPGQYINSHCIGLHRRSYKALIQQNPVTICRDNDQDDTPEMNFTRPESGLFGINIHRALSDGIVKNVDKFSAGCQVFQNPADFKMFMQFAEKHRSLHGNNFTYTLINEKDL